MNFGRLEQRLAPEEVYRLVLAQTRLLQQIAEDEGVRVRHLKPHGALYNQAARDARLAAAIVQAVKSADPALILFGPAGSALVQVGEEEGLAVANEVFADRSYESDGSLTPRSRPGAVIQDAGAAVAQALGLITAGRVRATDGREIELRADTLCLHGDGVHAVAFARSIDQALAIAGVVRKAMET
jgi:UPF0271 protein